MNSSAWIIAADRTEGTNQIRRSKGLPEKAGRQERAASGIHVLLVVSATKDHLYSRIEIDQSLKYLTAIESGHRQIQQDCADFGRVGFELAQSIRAIDRAQHRQTNSFQNMNGKGANGGFVVDDQHNAFGMPVIVRKYLGPAGSRSPIDCGKEDAKHGPSPGLTVNLQGAVM